MNEEKSTELMKNVATYLKANGIDKMVLAIVIKTEGEPFDFVTLGLNGYEIVDISTKIITAVVNDGMMPITNTSVGTA